MNLLKRQLKGYIDDNISIISSASKKSKISPDFNKSPALYKPRKLQVMPHLQ